MGLSVLFRLTWRYVSQRFFQSVLFVAGIALGVAVGVAIDLANSSARRAFGISVDSVSGRTTHQIVAGPGGLSTELYHQIRVDLGIRTAAPIIEAYVQDINHEDLSLRLLGIDPIADVVVRDFLAGDAAGQPSPDLITSLFAMIATPNSVMLSSDLAQRLEVGLGDSITLQTPTQQATVVVKGLLSPSSSTSASALENLILTDIATAQEIAGRPGKITRIDLVLPSMVDLTPLQKFLPPNAVIQTPNESSDALAQMTDAFELNLQALSLLALLVGIFLIYNTVTFNVIQRRPVIGILRAVGATRRQIFILILSESMILGTIGTGLGLILGVFLGQGVVSLVSQTINDLYFRVNVETVSLSPMTLARGAIVGIVASLVAATIPSIEATRTPPVGTMRRSSSEDSARRWMPVIGLMAALLVGAGIIVLRLPNESVVISFAGLFMVLVGCALLTPIALRIVMRVGAPLTALLFGVLGRMAPRSIVRSLSRTSVAVAALTLAVSVIVGVSAMISSFRQTVTDWLDVTLGADVFISPEYDIDANIDPALAAELGNISGVSRVTTVRSVPVLAPDYPDLPPVNLVAPDSNIARQPRRFAWYDAPFADYWQALEAGYVIVSEPFAFRRNISRDKPTLTLLTDKGSQTFPIAGVYYDYSTDQGNVLMLQRVYREFFDDPYVSAIALDLDSSTEPDTIVNRLQTGLLSDMGLEAQSNRTLREKALEVFNRTFSITVALRLLAIIVAFIGILSTLMSLQLEQIRQYGILRATGMTPRQLHLFTFIQTGLMGSVAGMLALPIGVALAAILIYVINVRSFGWTMDLMLRPSDLVQAFAVALAAALAAGVYPAWRLGKLVTVEAIRSE